MLLLLLLLSNCISSFDSGVVGRSCKWPGVRDVHIGPAAASGVEPALSMAESALWRAVGVDVERKVGAGVNGCSRGGGAAGACGGGCSRQCGPTTAAAAGMEVAPPDFEIDLATQLEWEFREKGR